MKLRTCVSPQGRFVYGVHNPAFEVVNLRQHDHIAPLGSLNDRGPLTNRDNFPPGDVRAEQTDAVFEIPNPFPFRGTTYIGQSWADNTARRPEQIALPPRPEVSLSATLSTWARDHAIAPDALGPLSATLPEPLQIALAVTSTDPQDLTRLAENACRFEYDPATGRPVGLQYHQDKQGRIRPHFLNKHLFKAVANNPFLPDDYKEVMVLRPGVQGASEIVGDYGDSSATSHVFEYLRCNSYIAGGHYAANMAPDAVRYRTEDLKPADVTGMRHLYYQRTYVRLAAMLDPAAEFTRHPLTTDALELLRRQLTSTLQTADTQALPYNSTLWGWNFGFDYAPSGYRLHASHQQVHQQYAMIPRRVATGKPSDTAPDTLPAYACGDLIADFIKAYRAETGRPFFDAYLLAIQNNHRMDGQAKGPHSLIVHADDRVVLFVPKAQTSQWELQLMPLTPVGNIVEADTAMRASLDKAIYTAITVLGAMGARMVTSIEFSKRIDAGATGQHLLYSILPRLPESPGAFSEAQLRWINGHYPEDFAAACRRKLATL